MGRILQSCHYQDDAGNCLYPQESLTEENSAKGLRRECGRSRGANNYREGRPPSTAIINRF